jgi:hypothetical protein
MYRITFLTIVILSLSFILTNSFNSPQILPPNGLKYSRQHTSPHPAGTQLNSKSPSSIPLSPSTSSLKSRRSALRNISLIIPSLSLPLILPSPSSASYSAYANREKDWQDRTKSKDIQISTARDLKRQLREIAPENERSEKFCPNGPSSAVSPLMENRCGDRLASASVFGRQEDSVGNSVPGFDKGYKGGGTGGSLNVGAVGGFPSYGGGGGQGTKLLPR